MIGCLLRFMMSSRQSTQGTTQTTVEGSRSPIQHVTLCYIGFNRMGHRQSAATAEHNPKPTQVRPLSNTTTSITITSSSIAAVAAVAVAVAAVRASQPAPEPGRSNSTAGNSATVVAAAVADASAAAAAAAITATGSRGIVIFRQCRAEAAGRSEIEQHHGVDDQRRKVPHGRLVRERQEVREKGRERGMAAPGDSEREEQQRQETAYRETQ
jgi:hypothetical protein